MSETVRKLWKDYSLGIVLLACFILTCLQAWSGWRKFAAPASADGLGDDGYVWEFLAATFENWQSEFLQLLVMVVLTSFLISPRQRKATIAWKPSSMRSRLN